MWTLHHVGCTYDAAVEVEIKIIAVLFYTAKKQIKNIVF